jgi:hypothetical protein
MTTVRKIVTSKIDGNNSNDTNTSEIHPFGEIAFYQNTDEGNSPNKLELLIFDGIRTHLKSKVLAKGRLYGGDADSGDGSGLDTIKLIPDAQLHYNDGNFNNHQYLVVDPTAPNHIHLRAGGTIDQSNADLFLGGERNHIRVSDGYDNVQITTDAGEGGLRSWTFGTDGSLTFPGGSRIETEYGGDIRLLVDGTDQYVDIRSSIGVLVGNNSTGPVTIGGSNGRTEIVSDKVIFINQAVPTSSLGGPGDSLGCVAFDGTYMYYCAGNFGASYQVPLIGGYSGNAFPALQKGEYPQPQAGWTFVWNTVTYTIDTVTEINEGQWQLQVDQTIDTLGGGTVTLIPSGGGNIWKRVAWSADTW